MTPSASRGWLTKYASGSSTPSTLPLDPASQTVVQSDDAPVPFQFTLRNGIVRCCGAFCRGLSNRPLAQN